MILEDKQLLRVRFLFNYLKNNELEFTKKIQKGLRTSIWHQDPNFNTAVIIIPESKEIELGKTCYVEAVLLQPIIFKDVIKKGKEFFFGLPGKKLATGIVDQVLGYWSENIPLP